MKQAMTQADLKAANKAIDAAEKAAQDRHAEPEKAPGWRDMAGPSFPVDRLQFVKDISLPGSFFGGSLEAKRDPRQKRYLIDYFPKMQMYLVTYIPAPGQIEPTVTELVPRELATCRPL